MSHALSLLPSVLSPDLFGSIWNRLDGWHNWKQREKISPAKPMSEMFRSLPIIMTSEVLVMSDVLVQQHENRPGIGPIGVLLPGLTLQHQAAHNSPLVSSSSSR